MKILHTADWHLGNVFHGYARIDEHRHFLSWLLDVLRLEQPDALVIAGDVFDSANPPAAAERLFYDFLLDATEAVHGLQIVVIAGNHDSAHRLEAPAELLRTHNVYVRGLIRRDAETDKTDFDHYILPLSLHTDSEACLTCLAVPYLRPSDYPGGLTPTEGLAWFIQNTCRAYAKSAFKSLPFIVAAHFYAAGADICADEHSERLVVGGQECVDAATLDCGAAYVALGHIHKAQHVAGGYTEMHYAGSVLPMSFSEKNYRHGINCLTVDSNGETALRRIDYQPLRGLISIPQKGAATPAEVFEAIDALPRRDKDDTGDDWPYLEIRVAENQPMPSLMHEVTEALSKRAVRFCRMVRQWPETTRQTGRPAHLNAIRQLTAQDIANEAFEAKYASKMPEALAQRLQTAIEAATTDTQD